VEQGHERDNDAAGEIGDYAGPPKAETIDEPAADEPPRTIPKTTTSPVRPVLEALPVVCKTNQGIAMNVSTLSVIESLVARA
jgi:hypothetical protein